MEATITGENDERVGLYVDDNNGVEHWIEMEFDGEIKYHEQEGYPDDPSERTLEEGEHVEQARRYARHHVYRERGYETFPEGENPDRIGGALLAILSLSDETFEARFGDLYAQLAAGHVEELTRPVEVPPAARDAPLVVFKQGVYLQGDPETLRELTPEHLPDVLEDLGDLFDGIDASDLDLADVFAAVDPRRRTGLAPDVDVE